MASAVAAVAVGRGDVAVAQSATRVSGIDVSEFQGSITWSTVKNSGGKSFAFIRSSRGGTTGSSTGGGGNTVGLGRYDDPKFYTNISNAKAAGVYSGPYHFSRADINTSPNVSTGTDEANHFLQQAGSYMKPGYLLPVLDLEQGSGRSVTNLSTWAVDFATTIHAATGVYPIIYLNSSYAMDEVNSSVVAKMPNQWLARPDADSDPATGEPIPASAHLTPATGLWPTWKFWQYVQAAPSGTVPGVPAAIDLDVGHGTTEWMKDFLVPAYWTAGASGNWAAAANWNSNNPAYNGTAASGPPSRSPGNISGTPNLSGADDTVILDNTMTTAAYTVTLDSGSFNIRKLYVQRPLNIAGGSLTINYDPTTTASVGSGSTILGSTTFSAQFSQAVTMTGGALSVHTLLVDNTRTFTLSGGALTLNTLSLTSGSTPAKLLVGGDVALNPLNNAAAIITTNSSTNSGVVDLGGGTRTLTVGDGSGGVDLALNVPISNGSITKAGPGTLQLNKAAAFNSTVTVDGGTLIATQSNQLGTGASVGAGGSLYLSGNLSYGVPLTLAGVGAGGAPGMTAPGKPGNLHVPSGSATWAGPISLVGAGSQPTDSNLNTVSAASGATLTLSGAISPGLVGAAFGLGKADNGTVVLTGLAPNTYNGPTHVYGGQLILEKDAALGSASAPTFMLAGSTATVAFRSGSSLNYATQEYLLTEGTGNAGLAQVDNLSGNNTFAGSIGIGGPSVGGAVTGSIGVTAGALTLGGGVYARAGYASNVRTINKTGAGTLILAGDSSLSPATTSAVPLSASTINVNAGSLELHGPTATTANVPAVSAYTVAPGASLVNFGGTLTGPTLNVSGLFSQESGRLQGASLAVNNGALAKLNPSPSAPSVLSSLTLNGTGTLDLTSNDLAVDYSGGTVADAVRQELLSGRNGGTWTGAGIVSSAARASSDPQLRTAIGYADASAVLNLAGVQTASWQGAAVDATTLLLKYTWYGDANLDGKIDGDDYALLDRGLAKGLTGWSNGDFNYDNAVDQNDYLLIDRVSAQQSGTLSPDLLAAREAQFGAAYVSGLIASVPEPTSAAYAAGLIALLARRRRRRGNPATSRPSARP